MNKFSIEFYRDSPRNIEKQKLLPLGFPSTFPPSSTVPRQPRAKIRTRFLAIFAHRCRYVAFAIT